MRTVPERLAVEAPFPRGRLLFAGKSPEFGIRNALLKTGASNASWFSASKPLAVPFSLETAATVLKLGWMNGSSASVNFDMGIYDTGWVRKVSTGGTARSGTSAWQWVDIADTTLAAGDYFLAGVSDSAAASQMNALSLAIAAMGALYGLYDSGTSAYPLPDPLTNMVAMATSTLIPVFGMVVAGSKI